MTACSLTGRTMSLSAVGCSCLAPQPTTAWWRSIRPPAERNGRSSPMPRCGSLPPSVLTWPTVASDDGYLYCLSLADGALLQLLRGAPSDAMILGNERMTSRWPARGGPVIRDGIVYFGAGLWQSNGIFLLAIDAESGRQLWCNEDAGKIYMPQPHGGANAESGVSAQGYLVATANELIVPTGLTVPAIFERENGRFRYYHLQANGHVGGTLTVAGDCFYNGGVAFNLGTGLLESKLGPGSIVRFQNGIIHGGPADLRRDPGR